jgi:hypothetical protein
VNRDLVLGFLQIGGEALNEIVEALLETLRTDFGYEILVFSPLTGLLEWPARGAPLSANVVAGVV